MSAVRGVCPTPRKQVFLTFSFAERILIEIRHRTGADLEIYECVEHWHIRDRTKRRAQARAQRKRSKARRKMYKQLTIYDWMNELDGTQGI